MLQAESRYIVWIHCVLWSVDKGSFFLSIRALASDFGKETGDGSLSFPVIWGIQLK